MIEIVLDTETTGLSVAKGHRIVEIGCIELKNQIPTSNTFLPLCLPFCLVVFAHFLLLLNVLRVYT